MRRVEDRQIVGPSRGDLRLRIYTPDETADDRCAILFMHGSGFVLGSIETHDAICRWLALSAAAIVVSVDYGLAPEHKFPAPPEECYAALSWLSAHHQELGVREARIGVAGDSAGGALAAALTMMSRDRGGPEISAQLLMYPSVSPALDTDSWKRYGSGYLLTEASMRWYWEQYLRHGDDATNPYAAPLAADDLEGLPPAVVMTGCCDPLRDEGHEYADRLGRAVDVTHLAVAGGIHGFLSMTALSPLARNALRTSGELLGCAMRRSLV
jgi:acetyl esterase